MDGEATENAIDNLLFCSGRFGKVSRAEMIAQRGSTRLLCARIIVILVVEVGIGLENTAGCKKRRNQYSRFCRSGDTSGDAPDRKNDHKDSD